MKSIKPIRFLFTPVAISMLTALGCESQRSTPAEVERVTPVTRNPILTEDAVISEPLVGIPPKPAATPGSPIVSSVKNLFNIGDAAEGKRIIFIQGEITKEMETEFSAKLRAFEKTSSDVIEFRIDSPGGNVDSMLKMCTEMLNTKSPRRTVVTGMAASAATLITACGNAGDAHRTALHGIHGSRIKWRDRQRTPFGDGEQPERNANLGTER